MADDRFLVGGVLFEEEFEAGDRDDAGGDALGFQLLLRLDRDLDFRTGGKDRDLRIAGRDQLIGALGAEVAFFVFRTGRMRF